MSGFSDMLAFLRKRAGMSQKELSERIGVSRSAIGMYETGEREPDFETLEALADTFNVGLDVLLGKSSATEEALYLEQIEGIRPITTKRFPLLGTVACGEPILAEEHFEAYVEAGADIQADFCLRAKGDSMIGARIQDGDIVFIRQQESVADGEIAAVLIKNEATLKRVYFDREHELLQLFAENPSFPTLRFSGEELGDIRILGKAVAFQSDVR